MKNLFTGLMLTVLSTQIYAQHYNTRGYLPVVELKTWASKIDVYINDSHQCSGEFKTRYLLGTNQKNEYASLMVAMASRQIVSLRYSCNSEGYPVIAGVRVRNK